MAEFSVFVNYVTSCLLSDVNAFCAASPAAVFVFPTSRVKCVCADSATRGRGHDSGKSHAFHRTRMRRQSEVKRTQSNEQKLAEAAGSLLRPPHTGSGQRNAACF